MQITVAGRVGLEVGTPVLVRNRFDGSWCPGFEVVAVEGEGEAPVYTLRRLSDGFVLPGRFSEERIASGAGV